MPRHNPHHYTRKIRNRTGLRNRGSSNRSTYATKPGRGDYYGKWDNGKCVQAERISRVSGPVL